MVKAGCDVYASVFKPWQVWPGSSMIPPTGLISFPPSASLKINDPPDPSCWWLCQEE